jgi:hypothetical protein
MSLFRRRTIVFTVAALATVSVLSVASPDTRKPVLHGKHGDDYGIAW